MKRLVGLKNYFLKSLENSPEFVVTERNLELIFGYDVRTKGGGHMFAGPTHHALMVHAGQRQALAEALIFDELMDPHVLWPPLCGDEDDGRNVYAIIAEHYRLAASVQLHGLDDEAILWWAFAALCVRSHDVRGDGQELRAISENGVACRENDPAK